MTELLSGVFLESDSSERIAWALSLCLLGCTQPSPTVKDPSEHLSDPDKGRVAWFKVLMGEGGRACCQYRGHANKNLPLGSAAGVLAEPGIRESVMGQTERVAGTWVCTVGFSQTCQEAAWSDAHQLGL